MNVLASQLCLALAVGIPAVWGIHRVLSTPGTSVAGTAPSVPPALVERGRPSPLPVSGAGGQCPACGGETYAVYVATWDDGAAVEDACRSCGWHS